MGMDENCTNSSKRKKRKRNESRELQQVKRTRAISSNRHLPASNDYSLINEPSLVDEAVKFLEQCTDLGLDFEFDADHFANGLTMCLVQVCGNGKIFLFDALAGLDLRGLLLVFENPTIVKVVHSCSSDLQLLHSQRCTPQNLFDTEICAKLLNCDSLSLKSLAEVHLGVCMDKSLQRVNWTKRPFTSAQLEYAAMDVRFLSDLKSKLMNMAKERCIEKWVEEENKMLSSLVFKPKTSFVSKKDKIKEPQLHHVYNELLATREKFAKLANKPGFMMIRKEILLSVARRWRSIEVGVASTACVHFFDFDSAHESLRSPEVAREFAEAFLKGAAFARAMNQPQSGTDLHPCSRPIDGNRERLNFQRYTALQERLIECYGSTAGRFLLPKTLLGRLAREEVTIDMLELKYKRELFAAMLAAPPRRSVSLNFVCDRNDADSGGGGRQIPALPLAEVGSVAVIQPPSAAATLLVERLSVGKVKSIESRSSNKPAFSPL